MCFHLTKLCHLYNVIGHLQCWFWTNISFIDPGKKTQTRQYLLKLLLTVRLREFKERFMIGFFVHFTHQLSRQPGNIHGKKHINIYQPHMEAQRQLLNSHWFSAKAENIHGCHSAVGDSLSHLSVSETKTSKKEQLHHTDYCGFMN